MTTILGTRRARPTGRNIANAFGCQYSEDRIPSGETITIRYGNASTPDPTNTCEIINKRESVALISNKPRCKQFLLEHEINTPKSISFRDAMTGNARFPIIVRRVNHSQGRWFYIVNSSQELRRYDPNRHYCQEIVDKKDEFRLFVMNDKIIEANLKETPVSNPNQMIRNHTHGCFFRWVRVSSLDRNLKEMVRKAVSDCDLDFAAVDCATIRKDGRIEPTIFEINSAPGLIDRKLELFVRKIREYYM